METCRVFTKGPKLLHVHDNPRSITDALRCRDNGWVVNINLRLCLLPTAPWTAGDRQQQRGGDGV